MREPGVRSPQFVVASKRTLSDADRQAGVLTDCVGRLAGSTHREPPDADLREVVISSPDEPGGQIRLLTNLMDLDAYLLGLLYRYRWQVELFFRWLKVFANFEHLISESRSGVLLGFYVAVIGVLLMYLFTNAKPSKYAFSLLAMVARGGATLEDIAPILKERERQIARDKASLARRLAARRAKT
jgi:IS4 transposase